MFVHSAARIALTFAAASLMTVAAVLPVAAHAKTVAVDGVQQPVRSETKFCLRQQPVTGSIVAGKVCKTRGQWAAEGVTIDAKNVVHQD